MLLAVLTSFPFFAGDTTTAFLDEHPGVLAPEPSSDLPPLRSWWRRPSVTSTAARPAATGRPIRSPGRWGDPVPPRWRNVRGTPVSSVWPGVRATDGVAPVRRRGNRQWDMSVTQGPDLLR